MDGFPQQYLQAFRVPRNLFQPMSDKLVLRIFTLFWKFQNPLELVRIISKSFDIMSGKKKPANKVVKKELKGNIFLFVHSFCRCYSRKDRIAFIGFSCKLDSSHSRTRDSDEKLVYLKRKVNKV